MSITINVGGMFSGKTTALLMQGERHLIAGDNIKVFKPALDDRYSDTEIVSHTGHKLEAIPVAKWQSIDQFIGWGAMPDVIIIDEVQFFDKSIVDTLLRYSYDGCKIYCSGLDLDFMGKSFEVTAELMAVADQVIKHRAVCDHCSGDANVTAKKKEYIQAEKDSDLREDVGSDDKYVPLCWGCFFDYTARDYI